MVDDTVSFFAPAPTSLVQTVEEPSPFSELLRCQFHVLFPEDVSGEVGAGVGDAPVLEIEPSHSSTSSFCVASFTRVSRVQLIRRRHRRSPKRRRWTDS